MKALQQLSESENLKRILDENLCPVARMRLFSSGINTNNRILLNAPITGDKGCLACGNCIDACPVVREKERFVFTQNQRTSMALENIVGIECRRCYACVRACPQVSKDTKEFVLGFRRVEKFIHAYTAGMIFFLAASGIFLFHFDHFIPPWQRQLLIFSHAFVGFFLLLTPALYFALDRHHFMRLMRSVFVYGKADIKWLQQFKTFLLRPQKNILPQWQEFNTYHKFWASYLVIAIPILGITGVVQLTGETAIHPVVYGIMRWLHILCALMTDLLVILHLYFKLLRGIFRNAADMGASYQQRGDFHYPFLYDPKSR